MFKTIVADPPWPIAWTTGKTRVNGRGERHANHKQDLGYSLMPIQDIAALDVAAFTEPDAWLFLWTVDRFLIDGTAAAVAKAWGFTPKRLLIWKKSGFALGSFPRPQHESVLIATKGRPAYNLRNIGSVQDWKLVYEKRGKTSGRRHSAKPPGFFDLVERSVDGPYLEMFARAPRPGWSVFGNEVESDVLITAKEIKL